MATRLAYLSPEAQDALDLAKRAVTSNDALTPQLLLAAAFQVGALADEIPVLAGYLPPLGALADEVPAAVPVDATLQPVLGSLSQREMVTIPEMTIALLESQGGRDYLMGRGMAAKEIAAAVVELRGEAALGDDRNGHEPLRWRASPERQQIIETLSTYGRMLTVGQPPQKGHLRTAHYLQAIQKSLTKMRRPSVIVVGQPGTGKTALIYEFARMIVEGDPSLAPALRDRDVFELSPSFLRSGASMVGQYEERITSLIKVLEANPQVILFVDEVHSLLASGMHERGPFTEANEAFKTAIGRGAFSLIGATTLAEYRHYIAPDKALARRFGLVKVEPPTRDETIAILGTRLEQYRRHYAPLRIPDEVITTTVEMTEDLLPTRFQPDKSLELLDEACALCALADPPLEEVTERQLVQALEDSLGHTVVRPGTLKESEVLAKLREVIVEQDQALEPIAKGFVAGMAERDWFTRKGPRRIFFFCGPTGTGKTETARILSKILGGDREAMIRVDCNTLQGSMSQDAGPVINRLLGVPPGYIGYARGEGGLLSRIRDMPECVVLFDEIEKASPAISQVLLQVLDEGRVEDSDSNLLDFRRAFIAFTTNAGVSYETARREIGFGRGESCTVNAAGEASPSVTKETVIHELGQRGYGMEFFGRSIDFIIFESMTRKGARQILERELGNLHETADLRGFALVWEQSVIEHLLDEWSPRFGARWVFDILRNRIGEQLNLAAAQGELDEIEGIGRVTRILLTKRPDDEVSEKDTVIAGLAGRRREGDTITVFVY
jgi:ATP-dependent Clp protease ATP-binding subunit ClpC